MTDLPQICWAHLEPLLRESGSVYDLPSEVPGRVHPYYTARFTANVTNVDLNLFHDRVSLILAGDRWLPLLRTDYADADALVADLISVVRRMIESDTPWQPPSPLLMGRTA
jgi:hypothetical protein